MCMTTMGWLCWGMKLLCFSSLGPDSTPRFVLAFHALLSCVSRYTVCMSITHQTSNSQPSVNSRHKQREAYLRHLEVTYARNMYEAVDGECLAPHITRHLQSSNFLEINSTYTLLYMYVYVCTLYFVYWYIE